MAFGFDDALSAIPVVTGIFGAFGASSAAKRAQEARQKILSEYNTLNDTDYNNLVANNARNTFSAAGAGGDAIRALGANLGGGLAAAGVYGSSQTAGALEAARRSEASQIANLGHQNAVSEQGMLNANRRFGLSQALGIANNDYNNAREDMFSSQGGLLSGLGAFTQRLLAGRGIQPNTGTTNGANNSVLAPNTPGAAPVLTRPMYGPPAPVPLTLNRPAPSFNFGFQSPALSY